MKLLMAKNTKTEASRAEISLSVFVEIFELTGGLERTGQERTGQHWKEPDKIFPDDNIGKNRTNFFGSTKFLALEKYVCGRVLV